jgi:hypothetical protein
MSSELDKVIALHRGDVKARYMHKFTDDYHVTWFVFEKTDAHGVMHEQIAYDPELTTFTESEFIAACIKEIWKDDKYPILHYPEYTTDMNAALELLSDMPGVILRYNGDEWEAEYLDILEKGASAATLISWVYKKAFIEDEQ